MTIAVKKNNGHRVDLEFSVSDTGIGIEDDEMSVLFNSFAQAKRSIAREYGGSGLGLSICKSLVELMGGNIYVESSYGSGSTFRFTVEMQVPVKTESVFADNGHCEGLRVLLLVHNLRLAESYRKLFHGFGMTVDFYHVDNGFTELLLDEVESGSFDMVLIDTCGNVAGDAVVEEVLQRLLESNPELPVLLSAAFLSDKIKAIAGKKEAVRVVPRPLTPQKIILYVSPQAMADNVPVTDLELSDSDKLRLSRMKVMLVEDNSVNRMIAVGMLKKYGITVLEMEQGNLAVEWVFANTIDDVHAILMDIEMPVMDGYTATMQIRHHLQDRHLPIIAMTANTLNTDIQKCYQSGMDGHISKPVDPQKLVLALLDFAPAL